MTDGLADALLIYFSVSLDKEYPQKYPPFLCLEILNVEWGGKIVATFEKLKNESLIFWYFMEPLFMMAILSYFYIKVKISPGESKTKNIEFVC
jgi:hypothetical protein